jgi:hypothetical protein
MLLKSGSEEAMALTRKHEMRERERERQRAWAAETWEHARVLVDANTSPANWERQAGKKMTSKVLEDILLKLDKNFLFEVVPGNPTKKYLWHNRPGGRVKICLYENRDEMNPMPEFSIFDTKDEVMIDPDVQSVSRKDLPRTIWKGLEMETDPNSPNYGDVRGEGYEFVGDSPGRTTIKRPWHELVRGWRSVLARVVSDGLATPEAVERLVGGSDRLSWANITGKAQHALPF